MKKAIEFKPPKEIELKAGYKSVFLAGSIEMGAAEDWQKELIEILKDEKMQFFNPRRDDWDSSWKQTKSDPQFRGQVEWELNALEKSDVVAMYLDPKTKSPISLLELGLYARTNKLIVCCPSGFYRKGNVDVTCEKYDVKQVGSLKTLADAIKKW